MPTEPTETGPTGTGLTPANFASIVGAAQIASGSTHAEMTAESGGQKFTTDADISLRPTGSQIAARVDFGKSVGKARLRLLGTVLFLNLGAASGDKFVAVPYPPDKKYKVAAPFVGILTELDPVARVKLFAAAPGSVTQSPDPVTIDGVETTSFTLKIARSDSATITAFVGPDNLLRRVTGESGGGKVTIDYSRWGDKVEVVPPSSDDLAKQE